MYMVLPCMEGWLSIVPSSLRSSINRCNEEHRDSTVAGQAMSATASDNVNPSNLQSSVATGSKRAMRRDMQGNKRVGVGWGLPFSKECRGSG